MKILAITFIVFLSSSIFSNNEHAWSGEKKWLGMTIVIPPDALPIISDYKNRIGVNGKMRSNHHQGIDIAGESGQSIIAAAPGKVLETTIEKCWGPTIVIDHGRGIDGNKIIALYGHVDEILVKVGETVSRGQLIAKLGNNHNTFFCIAGVRHLHFQIGRKYRTVKNASWGHGHFLIDGNNGVNPHLYWASGKGIITCYQTNQSYPQGSLTYPTPCKH